MHEAVGEDQRAQRESLRKRLRDQRAALTEDAVRVASASVCAVAVTLAAVRAAARVALYAATRGELDPATVRAALDARGAVACYPRPLADEPPRLGFFAVSPARPLVAGRFAILEPPGDAAALPLDAIDVILVPGIAFARDGHRLGFGRGYYDHALAAAPRALRIGLAHDFQVLDRLPTHPGDEPVDLILTPHARIVTRARAFVPEEVLS